MARRGAATGAKVTSFPGRLGTTTLPTPPRTGGTKDMDDRGHGRTSCQPVQVRGVTAPGRPACCPHPDRWLQGDHTTAPARPPAGHALEKCVHWPVRSCSRGALRRARARRPGSATEDGRAAAARRAPLEPELELVWKVSRLVQARKARIEQTTQHLLVERSPQPIEPYCHCLDQLWFRQRDSGQPRDFVFDVF